MSMAVRRSRTTKIIIKLIMIYLVCVIPMCIYNIVFVLIQDNLDGEELERVQCLGIYLYCIYWLQYSINNFVYVFSSDKFKNALFQLLNFIFCCKLNKPPTMSSQLSLHGRSLHHRRNNTVPENCYSISQQITNAQRIKTPSESTIDLEEETSPRNEENKTLSFGVKSSFSSTKSLISDNCQLRSFRIIKTAHRKLKKTISR